LVSVVFMAPGRGARRSLGHNSAQLAILKSALAKMSPDPAILLASWNIASATFAATNHMLVNALECTTVRQMRAIWAFVFACRRMVEAKQFLSLLMNLAVSNTHSIV
jgi:hypothetical protein